MNFELTEEQESLREATQRPNHPCGPLEGTRVLDVSSSIGAYCTKLLGDAGAQVVKIEPPTGDELRRRPPWLDNGERKGNSLAFSYYHGQKHTITLDITMEASLPRLKDLGRWSDVIVLSPSPRADVAGFDPDKRELSWSTANSIVCAITPFGLGGPHGKWRATHLVSYAMSGAMHRFGSPDGPPVVVPGQLQWDEAGAHAAFCIVVALGVRGRVGGQWIDIAAQEVTASQDLYFEQYPYVSAENPRKVEIGIPPNGTWACRDGKINIAVHGAQHWEAFLAMVCRPDALLDPALASAATRAERADELRSIIAPLLEDDDKAELVSRGQGAGLPVSTFNTPGEFVQDPQITDRGFIVSHLDVDRRCVSFPGPAVRAEPPLFLSSSYSSFGTDSSSIANADRLVDSLASSRDPVSEQVSAALDGLRVLSFGAFVAGNSAAGFLGAMGADVQKIEPLARPEVLRSASYNVGPRLVQEPSGVPNTIAYASFSRGAEGLALDMSVPRGRELFRSLVSRADVLIENFGIGVMERWNCDFDSLKQLNPTLIMLSLSGFGRTGPRSAHRAYATNIASFTGLASLWGTPTMFTDYLAGIHGALGVVVALRHVANGGSGVHLDISQIEVVGALLGPVLMDVLNNERDAEPSGNLTPWSLLSGVYAARGEDRWVALELEDLGDWANLCHVLNCPEIIAEDKDVAREYRPALEAVLSEWIAGRSPHVAAATLQYAGLAAGAVQSIEDVVRDPQLRQRHYPTSLPQPDIGWREYPGNPHRMTKTPGRFTRGGPRLGEHTYGTLWRWLGLDAGELRALEDAGVIYQSPSDQLMSGPDDGKIM